MTIKILVFGRTGQVARALADRTKTERHDLQFLSRDEVDLENPDACATAIADATCDIVVNAAAYTAVDKAEEETALARTVNALSPEAMARAAANRDIPFIHLSTDYVFDGTGDAAWKVDDPVCPVNAYGATKAEGEKRVAAAGGRSIIIRTSWVFSEYGNNFVKTMLRVGQDRSRLRVVNDQIGGPTAACDIADAVLAVADRECAIKHSTNMSSGLQILHFSGQPFVSWAGFAEAIFASAGMNVEIEGVDSAEYPTAAKRPHNSRLDPGAMLDVYGVTPPDWCGSLKDICRKIDA